MLKGSRHLLTCFAANRQVATDGSAFPNLKTSSAGRR